MIWLTWRQHRAALAAGSGLLAVVAAYVLLTGYGMRSSFSELGLDSCASPAFATCASQAAEFTSKYSGSPLQMLALVALPALAGVFWGAPLIAREVESGTHRMAWTQSISRRRWLVSKVSILGLALIVGLSVLGLLCFWYYQPLISVGTTNRFDGAVFDVVGLVPLSYGLAALAIGVAAGAFTRKVVPAIALTLVLFVVLRVGVEVGIRPHFMEPVTSTTPYTSGASDSLPPWLAGDMGWRVSSQLVDGGGRVLSGAAGAPDLAALSNACADVGSPITTGDVGTAGFPSPTPECIDRLDLRYETVHQPDHRFWRFQITESLLYLALSFVLIAASTWWIRHRVS